MFIGDALDTSDTDLDSSTDDSIDDPTYKHLESAVFENEDMEDSIVAGTQEDNIVATVQEDTIVSVAQVAQAEDEGLEIHNIARKKRNKRLTPENWKQNQSKQRRLRGMSYESTGGKQINSKVMGPPCNSKFCQQA